MNKTLVWHKPAFEAFQKAIDYIAENSPQNAIKVQQDILDKLEHILKYPESFGPDKYRINNKEYAYRALEIHKFRISYLIQENRIMVLRFRSARMRPEFY